MCGSATYEVCAGDRSQSRERRPESVHGSFGFWDLGDDLGSVACARVLSIEVMSGERARRAAVFFSEKKGPPRVLAANRISRNNENISRKAVLENSIFKSTSVR